MEINTILILVVGISAGTFFGFLVRKLLFEKNHVNANEYNSLSKQVTELSTEKRFIESQLSAIKDEKEKVISHLSNLQQEVNSLTALLAERSTEKQNSDKDVTILKDELEKLKQEKQKTTLELITSQNQVVELNSEIKSYREKLDTQKQEIEKLGAKFEDAFKVLAQQILDDKTKKFTESQEQNLKALLGPLQTQINQFKTDIESKQQQESRERISLSEHIKLITQTNQTLSEQANKLAETLRLQVKQQGDWGESILEAILENSGLQKGLQYFTQQSSRNDDGKTIRPDVLVKYPDQRTIIIDSKVSLVHYYEMCNAVNEEDQKQYAKQLVQSLYSHIEGLAGKNYTDIAQALDFVIMFVPVETAYIAAMHADPELWQYAYKKGILLISPANLIATLKLVKDMWRKDAVDKNAEAIADRAGKLYDKLVSFVDTFEKVGGQIEKAGESWTEAKKQLMTGRGNLISQATQMEKLHIKSKNKLSDQMVQEAILSDEILNSDGSNNLSLYE